ncbi:hypothetical protein C8J56DRAFT_920282 [Mycena floridula]|nr:hypothetical protein C8J56DRAFT_920282 [Mycena floridula]
MPGEQIPGHRCPKSDATNPADRWETLFIYSFILKYTNLKGKVEGLNTPLDLEEALMSREPNPILSDILVCFVLNLKPQTRNLSMDQISSTVASVLGEYFKTSEQTVFWNDEYNINVDPFPALETGFFASDWDFKLKVLRQLVELQLSHSVEIKSRIDRAWGAAQKSKKKSAAQDPGESDNLEDLQFVPLGQDLDRNRFWVIGDSPRIYVSTNPWKITATFHSIASNREEYIATIDRLKESAPPPPVGREKRTKLQQSHISLITALEDRIEAIDAETARIQKAKRRLEQKRMLVVQSELRETRTRRQTHKPDYVYPVEVDSEDDAEYNFQDDGYEEDDFEADFMDVDGLKNRRAAAAVGNRRSARSTVVNANNKRDIPQEDPWIWRGERRSTRLGAPAETQIDTEPPLKRARTEESNFSGTSGEASHIAERNALKLKASSAAALKPTEAVLEAVAGKKKSKFWVYAVDELSAEDGAEPNNPDEDLALERNGHNEDFCRPPFDNSEKSMADSLSPMET